jgi:hypothetical protein
MTSRSFALKPFPGQAPRFPLTITGTLTRRGSTLALRYELRGDLAAVALPAPAAHPARRDELWRETCCEFFLAPHDSPQYWEFNLSPAGHWNVYGFPAYRRGMHEEPALTGLPFTVRREPASLLLTLEVDLAALIPANQALAAGLAAVIQGRDGALTYWALAHPGPQPDFHRRDSFVITL